MNKVAKHNLDMTQSMIDIIKNNKWSKEDKLSRTRAGFNLAKAYLLEAEKILLKLNPSASINQNK